MMTAMLAVIMAMVAWKHREWHDELQRQNSMLQKRVEELERALVREECRRNDYVFTTRRPTTFDMEK